eukprot:COSAG05_NODE_217_length_13794_cov_5.734064_3_plen_71_part_00
MVHLHTEDPLDTKARDAVRLLNISAAHDRMAEQLNRTEVRVSCSISAKTLDLTQYECRLIEEMLLLGSPG